MDLIEGDRLRGHLEALVLASLEDGPAHGLEILRRLEDAGSGALRLKEGSLYPALYRLEESKLVVAEVEAAVGRRGAPRRVYALTPRGRKRLAAEREQWADFVRVVGGILGGSA